MIIPIRTCRRTLGLKDVFLLKGGRYPGVPEPEPEYLRVPGPAGQREPVPQLQRHTAVVSLRSRQGWFGVLIVVVLLYHYVRNIMNYNFFVVN